MSLSLLKIYWIFSISITLKVKASPSECHDKCPRDKSMESLSQGTWVCLESDKAPMQVVVPECWIQCYASTHKLASDQQSCLCKVCKADGSESAPSQFDDFCTAPGEGGLKSIEECDTTICVGKGNLKYRGPFCDPTYS